MTVSILQERGKGIFVEAKDSRGRDSLKLWLPKRFVRADGSVTPTGEKIIKEEFKKREIYGGEGKVEVVKGRVIKESEKAYFVETPLLEWSSSYDVRTWIPKKEILSFDQNNHILALSEKAVSFIMANARKSYWAKGKISFVRPQTSTIPNHKNKKMNDERGQGQGERHMASVLSSPYSIRHGVSGEEINQFGIKLPRERMNETYCVTEMNFEDYIGIMAQSEKDGYYACYVKYKNSTRPESDESTNKTKMLAIRQILETICVSIARAFHTMQIDFGEREKYERFFVAVHMATEKNISDSIIRTAYRDFNKTSNSNDLLQWRLIVVRMLGELSPGYYKKVLGDIIEKAEEISCSKEPDGENILKKLQGLAENMASMIANQTERDSSFNNNISGKRFRP